jgi:hypothetical protein
MEIVEHLPKIPMARALNQLIDHYDTVISPRTLEIHAQLGLVDRPIFNRKGERLALCSPRFGPDAIAAHQLIKRQEGTKEDIAAARAAGLEIEALKSPEELQKIFFGNRWLAYLTSEWLIYQTTAFEKIWSKEIAALAKSKDKTQRLAAEEWRRFYAFVNDKSHLHLLTMLTGLVLGLENFFPTKGERERNRSLSEYKMLTEAHG